LWPDGGTTPLFGDFNAPFCRAIAPIVAM
jgi:hypothetical protein